MRYLYDSKHPTLTVYNAPNGNQLLPYVEGDVAEKTGSYAINLNALKFTPRTLIIANSLQLSDKRAIHSIN
ncbi:MAG: hypothetical protein WKF59_15540 [Chitinophagaceae bacterium]